MSKLSMSTESDRRHARCFGFANNSKKKNIRAVMSLTATCSVVRSTFLFVAMVYVPFRFSLFLPLRRMDVQAMATGSESVTVGSHSVAQEGEGLLIVRSIYDCCLKNYYIPGI